MDKFIASLKRKEADSIVEVMAFMSYNPSIGRVMQKGSVGPFQKMALKKVHLLKSIKNVKSFDSFHGRWVVEIRNKIKTNRGRRCSYGQAQKAINVFLKLFVDWAGLPDRITAKKILPFLHVPLDSILMDTIWENYSGFYEGEIKPLQKENNWNLSLSKIGKIEYLRWQMFFREKHPTKPLLFDIAWAMNR